MVCFCCISFSLSVHPWETMVISCLHPAWKLTLIVHLYWSLGLSRHETCLTRKAFSSIPPNPAIIKEPELLSMLSSLCSNFLTHWHFFHSAPVHPLLMSSIAALFHYAQTLLFSPRCSCKSLSPGPAHQTNALPYWPVLGLLQSPLPARLPSKLLLQCKKLSLELVHEVIWSWMSSPRSRPSSKCTRRHESAVRVNGRTAKNKQYPFLTEKKRSSTTWHPLL